MFMKNTPMPATRVENLLNAAIRAARAIPPAFPLDATVAVNPVMGQAGEPLATASARLGRVAGVSLTLPRSHHAAALRDGVISDDDLAAALIAETSALKPADLAMLKARLARDAPPPRALPTVADLAARDGGTDWPALIAKAFGLWAAGHFDRGQALWTPAPGLGAYAAWRAWASHDLTPEIAGLSGFCAHVAAAPDSADRAILAASAALGLGEDAAEGVFHRLLMELGGWAMHARWLLWEAELRGGTDHTLLDLLAIRLIWEEAILAAHPAIAADWAGTVAAHGAPIEPSADQVIDAILQEAVERAFQRRLASRLSSPAPAGARPRPALQVGMCIDVRSERFRRALESLDPGIETFGIAGFFVLKDRHLPHGSDIAEPHLPVPLVPTLSSTSHLDPEAEFRARIRLRMARAWGRFRQAAVSSFAFVEAAGPAYAVNLVRDALGHAAGSLAPQPAPRFEPPLPLADRVEAAATALSAISLMRGHAKIVLLLGHGAQMVNNPHESAYHCGACGGRTGEVSARLLAGLLNDPEVRAALPERGIDIPGDTLFLAGLHDTVTDEVTLYPDAPEPGQGPGHAAGFARVRAWLDQAGWIVREERAALLPHGNAATLTRRAADWAEVRPEWGLAGCAAFIAAPRKVTAGHSHEGRVFLHDYDWTEDADFVALERILTAPVVVASWISLQYYGSVVAPRAFGAGNKLIHNVTGGIGVVQGNGGILRAGLPWQAVHDGERLRHEPLRLSVLVEAPTEAIGAVIARHAMLADLFDNGWLHLFALDGGRIAARYRPGLVWQAESASAEAAAVADAA